MIPHDDSCDFLAAILPLSKPSRIETLNLLLPKLKGTENAAEKLGMAQGLAEVLVTACWELAATNRAKGIAITSVLINDASARLDRIIAELEYGKGQ